MTGFSHESHDEYGKFFQESSRRFSNYYHSYIMENQRNFEQLDVEFSNILTALDAMLTGSDMPRLAGAVDALDVYWDGRGYWQILRYWLETI